MYFPIRSSIRRQDRVDSRVGFFEDRPNQEDRRRIVHESKIHREMKQIENFRSLISDIPYAFEIQLTRHHFLPLIDIRLNILPRVGNNLENQPL